METLRIEPPVYLSISSAFSADNTLGPYSIKADTALSINIY